MKSFFSIVVIAFLLVACNSKTILEKEFSCNATTVPNAENVTDIKKLFTVNIPAHWKTNLFYDNMQSSIYAADTTKQLTESVLVDVTQVKSAYVFDKQFKDQLTQNDAKLNLNSEKQSQFQFKNKPAFYSISKGMKGDFSYQILNIFIQQNSNSSYHLKTEVYGDTAVKKRLCNGIAILNSIQIHEIQ